jgi:hypothetical protein
MMGVRHAAEAQNEHITKVHLKVGDIAPRSATRVVDRIFAKRETVLRVPVSTETADHAKITVTMQVVVAITLKTTIICRDREPLKREYALNFRRGGPQVVERALSREVSFRKDLRGTQVPTSLSVVTFCKTKNRKAIKDPNGHRTITLVQLKESELRQSTAILFPSDLQRLEVASRQQASRVAP